MFSVEVLRHSGILKNVECELKIFIFCVKVLSE